MIEAPFRVHSSPHAILWKKRKMGRLVKAFSKDDDDQRSLSDETQFLREAAQVAAGIQQELRAGDSTPGPEQQPPIPHTTSSDADSVGDSVEESVLDSRPRQLGRDVSSEPGGESTPQSQTPSFRQDSLQSSHEGLRLYTGPESERLSHSEPSEMRTSTDSVGREFMQELVQEQSRWTERHAMQVRSIEEQGQQIAQVTAEVELREQELDRRERELDARVREQATKAEAEDRGQISRDWEATQKEMDRLTAEVRVHADRASQFEAELAEVRREHATELDGVRSQLSLQSDSRANRAKSVIDECDQRMSELTAQRAAWQAEQSRRREELARERLEQRDELRQQREAQFSELSSGQAEFQKERDATIERLDRERREWTEKFNREQDELLDLKQAVEEDVARVRGDISREKAEWESHPEQLRITHREEQAMHQAALTTARQEMAEHSERERKVLAARIAEAEQLKNEESARFDRLRKELESEREAWHRERGQEAAILQAERSELETETDRLRAERSLIEVERQQLLAELEQKRTEHDESLRQSWRNHQASLQQAEQESTSRQRVLAEHLQQQENELSARIQQADHEIRTARELCSRQMAQDKERFSQTCATHEAEVQRARAELNVQRQQLERERLEFVDETARARQQTEQERSVVRNSLSQMDAQLRVAATSLLPGASTEAITAGFAEHLHPSVDLSDPPVSQDEVATPREVAEVEFGNGSETGENNEADNDGSDLANRAADETSDHSAVADCSLENDAVPPVESEGVDADLDDLKDDDAGGPHVAVWEPGKEATLVESASSNLIRHVDSAAESGGVSGLEKRPRIASRGIVAQATSEAEAAEIVYDDGDRTSEWAGIVATRTEETVNELTAEEQGDGRRQALESYRAKLSGLQDQLRQLSNHSTDETGNDDPADA
jgi:hypothetical protein